MIFTNKDSICFNLNWQYEISDVKDQPGHTHVSESKTNESEHSASSSNEVKSPSTHDQSLETKQEPSSIPSPPPLLFHNSLIVLFSLLTSHS